MTDLLTYAQHTICNEQRRHACALIYYRNCQITDARASGFLGLVHIMRIRYYTRDEGGSMSGPFTADGYSDVAEFLAENFREDETPEPAELLGWPDNSLVWYGDLGIVTLSGVVSGTLV